MRQEKRGADRGSDFNQIADCSKPENCSFGIEIRMIKKKSDTIIKSSIEQVIAYTKNSKYKL